MSSLRLIVFGPADGAVAFSFPGCQKINDDAIFLASSAFAVSEKGSVMRICRPAGVGARVALYRQAYEPHMSRLGHCFGATFDFAQSIPPGELIVETIHRVVDLVESHCCSKGEFCDYGTFLRFLREEIDLSMDGIAEVLASRGWTGTLTPILPMDRNRVHFELDSLSLKAVGRIVDWFFCNGAGATIDEAFVSSRGAGEAGATYRRADSVEAVSDIAIATMASGISILQKENQQITAEHTRAIADLKRLVDQNIRYKDALDQVERQIASLRSNALGAMPARQGYESDRSIAYGESAAGSLEAGRSRPRVESSPTIGQGAQRIRDAEPHGSINTTTKARGAGGIGFDDPQREGRNFAEPAPGRVPNERFLDSTVGFFLVVVALLLILGAATLGGLYVWYGMKF